MFREFQVAKNDNETDEYLRDKEKLYFVDFHLEKIIMEINDLFENIKSSHFFSGGEKILLAKNLGVIMKGIKQVEKMADSLEIIEGSHFTHAIGSFRSELAFIKKISEGKLLKEKESMFQEILKYRHYFSECAMNENFLKEELGKEKGAAII